MCSKFSDVHVTVHRDKFLKIKPTRCINFSNLFWNDTLHVSDISSVHHQEFFTVHTAVGICHTGYADSLWAGANAPAHKLVSKQVVSFQDKFEKLVHLVGFILRNVFKHDCECLVTCNLNSCGGHWRACSVLTVSILYGPMLVWLGTWMVCL